jgi:hypothetical protein
MPLQHEVAMQLLNYLKGMDVSFGAINSSLDDIQSDVNSCFDEQEGYVKVIDAEHHHIHDGVEFEYDHLFTSVAANAYVRFRVYNDDGKELHIQFFTDTEAKAYVTSYIDSTYSNNGTPAAPWNRSTGSTVVSVAKVYTAPTVNVLGALRVNAFTGVSGNPANQVGGSTGSRVESIITSGHDLLIVVQNKGSAAKDIAISARWYEVPEGV